MTETTRSRDDLKELFTKIARKIHEYGAPESKQRARLATLRRCRQTSDERRRVMIWSTLGHEIPSDIQGAAPSRFLTARQVMENDFLETLYLLVPIQATVKHGPHDFVPLTPRVDLALSLNQGVGMGALHFEPVERRLSRLLKTPRRNLEKQLLAVLQILRGTERVGIDWPLLYMDLFDWEQRRRAFNHNTVRTRWARHFYGMQEEETKPLSEEK